MRHKLSLDAKEILAKQKEREEIAYQAKRKRLLRSQKNRRFYVLLWVCPLCSAVGKPGDPICPFCHSIR